MLFAFYPLPLQPISYFNGVSYGYYADDIQLYILFKPVCSTQLPWLLKKDRMADSCLQPNNDKTVDVISAPGGVGQRWEKVFALSSSVIPTLHSHGPGFESWPVYIWFASLLFLNSGSLISIVKIEVIEMCSCHLDYCNSLFTFLEKTFLHCLQMVKMLLPNLWLIPPRSLISQQSWCLYTGFPSNSETRPKFLK